MMSIHLKQKKLQCGAQRQLRRIPPRGVCFRAKASEPPSGPAVKYEGGGIWNIRHLMRPGLKGKKSLGKKVVQARSFAALKCSYKMYSLPDTMGRKPSQLVCFQNDSRHKLDDFAFLSLG